MLVNKLNSLFVHIPKTAGQSVEQALLDELGISWEDRRAHLDLLMHLCDDMSLPHSYVHLTCKQYLDHGLIDRSTFDSMFKFAFVRNPWARVVSSYHYLRFDTMWRFKDFLFDHLQSLDPRSSAVHFIPQTDFLVDNDGEICVDFVGYFENLHEDFTQVAERMGLAVTALPYRNKNATPKRNPDLLGRLGYLIRLQRYKYNIYRNTRSHYTEYYDSESREFIANIYHRDIENFGYTFEGVGEFRPSNVPVREAHAPNG
jgi:hypothetical protein